tara:strand:+ start:811 stop:1473 length:663 start_codon:yes stop_codon:yes gene_type:complete
MKNICAVIAARSGSKRVKNKNIRRFGKSSLLVRKIIQLKKIKILDDIYVNSNDNKILSIAKKNGAKIIKREKKYATNYVKINDVYVNVVKKVPSKHIFFVHITSPFVKTKSMEDAIKKYFKLNKKKYDCLASTSPVKKFLWFKNKAINYNPKKMPRSQDLPDFFYLNFAFNILTKKNILKYKNIIGKKIKPFHLDEIESFDIDNMEEFKLANLIENKIKI